MDTIFRTNESHDLWHDVGQIAALAKMVLSLKAHLACVVQLQIKPCPHA